MTVLAVTATTLSMDARQLSLEEAMAKAGIHQAANQRSRSSVTDGYTLVHTEQSDGINTLYILNSQKDGYMILSADDVAAPSWDTPIRA